MNVIGWPTRVNDRIIDETSITIGEGGFVEDSDANGYKERRLTSLATPDKFNVVMDFNWGGEDPLFPVDEKGDSEYDRFVKWYKFKHKRGANPFWFPCITRHSVDNLQSNDNAKKCLYRITSALTPQKSGFSMRISMTWEEVYSGIISVPENDNLIIDHITASNGSVIASITKLSDTLPTQDDISLKGRYFGETEYSQIQIQNIVNKGRDILISFERVTRDESKGNNYQIVLESTSDSIEITDGSASFVI